MPNYYPNYPFQQPSYQPQQSYFPVQPQNPINSSVIWVGSRSEAESYLVGANNAVTMWDSNGEYVYMKKTDASGRPEFHAYKLLEEGAETPNYVTKDDFTKLENRINSLSDKIKALRKENKHESDDD